MSKQHYKTIDECVGGTPLVRLQRLNPNPSNIILAKLEGNNPAGSVKDRAALNMINEAENRGDIKPGDRLIEATSGNTGIALAMVAAIKGYKMTLIMQENLSQERRDAMTAYGAELILVSKELGMEGARDLANEMSDEGKGLQLNQFANEDNPKAHLSSTAQEIWSDTNGEITHFVSSMGTTGTIMGVSKYLKEKKPSVQIIGIQPDGESHIPGIRRWPEGYLPTIFDLQELTGLWMYLKQVQSKPPEISQRMRASFLAYLLGELWHPQLNSLDRLMMRLLLPLSAIEEIDTCPQGFSSPRT
jgi:cysteine synthase B